MQSRLKKIFLGLLFIFIAAAGMYFIFPGQAYNLYLKFESHKAGVALKSIQVDGYNIVYLEGGKGETIVLLHGFGGDKYNWVRFAEYLTPKYHVIIPDIPGFGESSKAEDAHYDVHSQVNRLNGFIERLQLKKFHIAGNSMGGYLSGMITALHGDKVISLNLIDAAGVSSPVKSEFYKGLENGRNDLIIEDRSGFDGMIKFIFYTPIYIPSAVKTIYADKAIADSTLYKKIFKELSEGLFYLEKKLGDIKCPALIMWGDSDRIIDISSVKVFENGIKNHKTAILKNCGHVPMMERPEESARLYLDFLAGLK